MATSTQKNRELEREIPKEWLDEARAALRPWEREESFLLAAIAKALQKMYERGVRGEYPQERQPAPARRRTVRRAHASPR